MSISETFVQPFPLNTAVLFLVFNRLDVTKQVFEAIREVKPPRLYVAADGARQDVDGEEVKVKAVREYIVSNIDWECEVKTLFRDQNLGCKYAVSGAIDWFFENEEMGIILEDDCLPSQSFFWFCEELLERYKDDMRIGQISGDNFQQGVPRGDFDYYFSIYSHIWGWASWANRWKAYDVELKSIKSKKFINDVIQEKTVRRFWINKFKQIKRKTINTWDFQWTFTLLMKKQWTILPNVNLIKNIGFGEEATHTKFENELSNLEVCEMKLEKHPNLIELNSEADSFTSSAMYTRKSITERIVSRVKSMMK